MPTSPAIPPVEPAPAPPPAARRVAALAVRLLETPAAIVLRRTPAGSWRVVTSSGEQADRLQGEMLRHAVLLDTERGLFVVPDLGDAPELAAVVPPPPPGTPRLRFLAAAAVPLDPASTAAAPASAADAIAGTRPRDWLCVFDGRARQFRAADRQLLQELADLLGETSSPTPVNAAPAARTADMIDVSLHVADPAETAVLASMAQRVQELTRLNDSLRADLNARPRGGNSLDGLRFEQLIDGASDFVGLASLDGKFHYLNRAGQRLVGLDGEEAVRRTRLIDYLMREDRSFFLGTVTPTLLRTGAWEGEFRFRNFKTGATIEVSWTLFLIRDPQTGEPADIAVVTRDITERKKNEAALRESEERFRHLVEQAGEAFFVYDLTGRVIDVNQEACESLGYTRADLLALSVGEIDTGFDAVKGKDRWKQMVPGVAVTMNGTHRRKDGTTFPTEERVAVFRSGNQRLLLALVRDITDRKRAEEAIQQSQAQLEARVAERTAELARANEAMRAASLENSRLAAAIDSSEIGVIIGDPRQPGQPTIFANPAFARLTGYSREEAVGTNRLFLPGPDTDEAELETVRKALVARRPYRGTVRAYRKDGTAFWDQLSVSPLFDDAGDLINFVGVHADVSAQIEAQDALRRSELRFSRMTANVPGMVYQLVLHADGTADFPYVSEGCRELFGLEPAEMRPDACTLLDRIHPDDIGGFLSALDESRHTGAAWSWEGRYLTGDDGKAERWLQGAARPERYTNGDTLWDGLLLDITKRKLAEAAISQAKEDAETADRAKSEFLSRMSHELRTPLNAILGFGQVLQMQKLPAAQNDRVGHIVTAGRHLLGLINEVLDISRIEAGRVELSLEPVCVADVADETLSLIKPLAGERGVELHGVSPGHPLHGEYVMADRQRFKQVLLNLLSNAVKYNRQGGTVRLTYAQPTPDGRLRMSVADTGAGIPADKLARLFVAFDRLGAENSDVQGTGLGLALSKRLIEAMGGQIGVDSTVGEGTSFWIELPRAQSQIKTVLGARTDNGAPLPMGTLARTHNVLYIEDNLSNLTLIEHLLADQPAIKLMTAMQGGLGLELARQHRPDLILLDLHLPDVPGWDVLAQLKADDATRAIPVIIVSADATPRQVERLMKAGALAYLTKPLEVDRFQLTLRQALEPDSV